MSQSRVKIHSLPNILPLPPSQPKSFQPEQAIPWGIKQIKAPLIWPLTMGEHIKIGVVDTGVDYTHPDLRSSLAQGINLLNRRALPYDDNGHGTHIAGTIAASNQRSGILGVAPQATIYPVKAFDHNGVAYVADIIRGIHWCVENQMDIINMSFGMKTRNISLLKAIHYAYISGVIIVASSGNDGVTKSIDYPARFFQTIAVGASTKNRFISRFSNKGKDIDIYAPGHKIFSTWAGGRYNELSGTSMAASHVTGAVALILAIKPSITPPQMKTMLRKAVNPYNMKQHKLSHNRSRSHILNALRLLNYISW